MNALEHFYIKLNQSGWDVKQESVINTTLQQVNEELIEKNQFDISHFAEIDRQAFSFSKSPEKLLSYRVAGARTLENGSELSFEWPDIKVFEDKDFEYLSNRFQTTTNLYSKTEYGLVLFYSKKKVENNFVLVLLSSLFELLKIYLEKAKSEENSIYISFSNSVLNNALYIANNRKEDSEINKIFKDLINFSFDTHQSWDINKKNILYISTTFTNFAILYFKDFNKTIDLNRLNKKNWQAVKSQENSNIWGVIKVANSSITLGKKNSENVKDWLVFKADQYEKLSIERKEDISSLSFIEKAISIYKNLGDVKNLGRLQLEYQKIRTEYHLGQVIQEIPYYDTQRIIDVIRKEISENDEEDIVKTLRLAPMIMPIEIIKKWNHDFPDDILFQNTPIKIIDKFGNTIKRYITQEEQNEYSLLLTYENHMQIASQTIVQYFIEAFQSEKISAKSIINLLNQTWIGKGGVRKVHGTDTNFSYIKLLESGINNFFSEMLKWKGDSNYQPDFVSATDSLVLKVEYFLREFCTFLDIPTFKTNPSGITMERLLDDILGDSKIKECLTPDDHFLFKFILTEKFGYNLRNKIAHGLMDDIDYSLENIIFSILIILKLSNYKFNNR